MKNGTQQMKKPFFIVKTGEQMQPNKKYNFNHYMDWLSKTSPKAYIQLLKDIKGSGATKIYYKDCDKLHTEYKIRKGVVHYWIYFKNGKIINGGIEK